MNSVVITGYEMITPLGATAEATWAGLKQARSGIARIRRFHPSGFAVRFAGFLVGLCKLYDIVMPL